MSELKVVETENLLNPAMSTYPLVLRSTKTARCNILLRWTLFWSVTDEGVGDGEGGRRVRSQD